MEQQFGKGRGGILLKLLKEKEKAEREAMSQREFKEQSQTEFQQNVEHTTEIPSSSNLGRGRSLLNVLKTVKSTENTSQSVSESFESPLPPIPVQISVPGQGRGSLLSRLKTMSLTQKPPEQSITFIPSTSALREESSSAGVLGKLSDMTIQETEKTSELSVETYLPVSRQGKGGKPIQLSGNYINLKLDSDKGLFNYEVKFNPDIDSRPLRRKLLNQQIEALGRTKVFDGVTLYLPQKLKQDITVFESTHPIDGAKISLTLIFKKKQSMSENIPFFNVLLGRVMRALSLVRIGQHSFNPKGIHSIPQHKLEVWPGYVTAINEYHGGLKLCIDARHRVMRTETVRDIM